MCGPAFSFTYKYFTKTEYKFKNNEPTITKVESTAFLYSSNLSTFRDAEAH